MNRIDKKFKELRGLDKKAFIAFITAGDPGLAATEQLVLNFESAGVDIVEIGVPFSDPLADGPTIQASSQRALQKGMTLEKILQLVKKIRRKSEIPLALMTYYNPLFHYGEERFLAQSKEAGVDGLIIPDLPVEEAGSLIRSARAKNISLVFFISPTTTKSRIKYIARASTGFIYYVSLTGVTGARESMASSILRQVSLVKKMTRKPVCVGFGISTPEQVKAVSQIADGVIVGSAIVKKIEQNSRDKNMVNKVSSFVASLGKGLH